MLTAVQVDDLLVARLATAVAALHPQARPGRWRSLTSAIVDAVWSIRSDYDSMTVPVTRRVFAASLSAEASMVGANPLTTADDRVSPDPVPLGQFLTRFPSVEALKSVSNGQLTSARGGIRKADAVLRHARVFVDHGITTRLEAIEAAGEGGATFDALNRDLARIPGEGAHGVRRGYLWMLLGDDDGVKPDAMVLRWLRHHDVLSDAAVARLILRRVAVHLSDGAVTAVSPWMVDHAVWSAGRLLR